MIGHGIGESWLVVFCEPDPIFPKDWKQALRRDRMLYRFLRLLKPGFRHVWAMKRAEHFNGWLILNTTSCGVHVFEVPDGVAVSIPEGSGPMAGRTFVDYHDFLMAMEDVGTVFTVVAPVQPGRFWRFRGLFTCVATVKHILGVQAWWVWTPWQLHQFLTRESRHEE